MFPFKWHLISQDNDDPLLQSAASNVKLVLVFCPLGILCPCLYSLLLCCLLCVTNFLMVTIQVPLYVWEELWLARSEDKEREREMGSNTHMGYTAANLNQGIHNISCHKLSSFNVFSRNDFYVVRNSITALLFLNSSSKHRCLWMWDIGILCPQVKKPGNVLILLLNIRPAFPAGKGCQAL